jgi:hypothetical protein
MTERPLRRDGFIWEVRRTLDESYRCCRREDQERILRKSVCPYILNSAKLVPGSDRGTGFWVKPGMTITIIRFGRPRANDQRVKG